MILLNLAIIDRSPVESRQCHFDGVTVYLLKIFVDAWHDLIWVIILFNILIIIQIDADSTVVFIHTIFRVGIQHLFFDVDGEFSFGLKGFLSYFAAVELLLKSVIDLKN